ncbi:MAG: hypothetical protein ACRD96_19060 [Bryobacteraceae bacterium]
MHRPYDITFSADRRQFLAAGLGWLWPFRRREARLEGARFRVVRRGRGGRRYLHIHGNESTAREALLAHVARHSGVAHLIVGNQRNVPVGGGQIDPNRMFSREGAGRNLRRLNPAWSEAELARALDALDRGRERLLAALLPREGGLLVAVHNNSEGYSVRDETASSDRVSIPDPDHPHEFFLCTQAPDFERLAESKYNVVLQNTAAAEDDGSLSRLAARRGVRYVNLECGLGKAREQAEMLEYATFALPERRPTDRARPASGPASGSR